MPSTTVHLLSTTALRLAEEPIVGEHLVHEPITLPLASLAEGDEIMQRVVRQGLAHPVLLFVEEDQVHEDRFQHAKAARGRMPLAGRQGVVHRAIIGVLVAEQVAQLVSHGGEQVHAALFALIAGREVLGIVTRRGIDDVDLLVIMPAYDVVNQAIRICGAFDRPFSFDMIVRTPQQIERGLNQNNWFLREIIEKGKVLYDARNGPVGPLRRRGFASCKRLGRQKSAPAKRGVLPLPAVAHKLS